MKIKAFWLALMSIVLMGCNHQSISSDKIMTITGTISTDMAGKCLIHEHVLVDFIGADQTSPERWDRKKVLEKVLPYLEEVKSMGFSTMMECTPAYLGRDPVLLEMLSKASGLQILTNTGYYGAVNNKFLPHHAFEEDADQLAARWIDEWENGIEGTDIRPGFIKISVNPDTLSRLHEKIVRAAARTHLQSGLTIASHTGPAIPAFEQIALLKEEGVRPEAFIWVHAQNETDSSEHIRAARMGSWISFDGVSDKNISDYVRRLQYMKAAGLLHKVLISHDAGWYRPEEEDGGSFRDYRAIQTLLLPDLMKSGFEVSDVDLLLRENPVNAFAINVRKQQ